MKYTIILFVAILLFQKTYGQFYLGKTESEVRKELKAQGYKEPVKVKQDNNTFSLMYDGQTGPCLIGFGRDGISLLFTVIPSSPDLVTGTIQEFNKTFVKISDTSWKAYKNGKVFNVVLSYSKNNGVYSFSMSESVSN